MEISMTAPNDKEQGLRVRKTWTVELFRRFVHLHKRRYEYTDTTTDESRELESLEYFYPIDNTKMMFDAYDNLAAALEAKKLECEELRGLTDLAERILTLNHPEFATSEMDTLATRQYILWRQAVRKTLNQKPATDGGEG